MRLKLATGPTWVTGVVTGLFYGAFIKETTLGYVINVPELTFALLLGALAGALFGTVMGPYASRLNRRLLGDSASMPHDQLKLVLRAASRGPAPSDPELRRAALGVALRGYDETMRTRGWAAVMWGFLLLLSGGLALTEPLWWLMAILVLALLIGLWASHILGADRSSGFE